MKVTQFHTQVSVKIENALKKMLKGTVPVMSTDRLADSRNRDLDWCILDSRELVEFEVSHLPDAKWVGHLDFSMSRVSNIPKSTRIVVYCSIGVRSENIAEKLMATGFSDVWNLYGGIFAWANEQKKLIEQNHKSTLAVHGYNQKWATLLVHHTHCKQTKKVAS